jgi:hypothetical protein
MRREGRCYARGRPAAAGLIADQSNARVGGSLWPNAQPVRRSHWSGIDALRKVPADGRSRHRRRATRQGEIAATYAPGTRQGAFARKDGYGIFGLARIVMRLLEESR